MAAGLSPSSASASVHIAELGTTALSGVAHHRFGNVDHDVVGNLAPAGALGAFLGATLLSSLSTETARPLASTLLLLLGLFVFGRFALSAETPGRRRKGRPCAMLLAPLGLIGGFVDATGGGGWGPVTTPALLANGKLTPSKVIGAVSAAEFVVAAAASVGFAASLGSECPIPLERETPPRHEPAQDALRSFLLPPCSLSALPLPVASRVSPVFAADGVRLPYVLALLAGGLFAAPLAACFVHKLPPRLLGVIVGGFICFTHARVLLNAANASNETFALTYGAMVSVWLRCGQKRAPISKQPVDSAVGSNPACMHLLAASP